MAGGVLVVPRPVVGTDHALGLQAELALSSELVLLALDPAQKDSAGHGLCLLPVPATLTRWGNPRERCVVRPGPVNRARRLDLLSSPRGLLGVKVTQPALVTPRSREGVELKPGSLLQEARHRDGPANV